MISVISTLKNRANLLNWGLVGLQYQGLSSSMDVHIGDGGSEDDLDKVLLSHSYLFNSVNKWIIDRKLSSYDHPFNCPALEYNILVNKAEHNYIVKIDPEFVFITEGFIQEALNILKQGRPAIIMSVPYHTNDFPIFGFDDIRLGFRQHVYKTHIQSHTAKRNNVYYGCVFRREDFIKLGGIDVRFLNGIGSEDDHFLDQWRRLYGEDNVITLLEHSGVHLWHGEWAKGVPQHLYGWVNKNADLRKRLKKEYPNQGDFSSIKFPPLQRVIWKNGKIV